MAKSKKRLHLHVASESPADGGNGHAHPEEAEAKYDIGASVPVPETAVDTITPTLNRIVEVQQQIGALTEEYEAHRMNLLRILAQLRQQYGEQVKQLGIDLGLNLGPKSSESWLFNPKDKVFIRQA